MIKEPSQRGGDPVFTLPQTWEEFRQRGSISRKETSKILQCSLKTVGRRVDSKELKESSKKRILCDDLLKIQIRKVHGDHVLR